MHFFSPANVMRLLEIVRGARRRSPSSRRRWRSAGRHRQGRCARRGLLRLCRQPHAPRRRREAQQLILEGASPAQVDRVLNEFGFPMGPFATSDLAGLDMGGGSKETKSILLRGAVSTLRDGSMRQKTGAGFYQYDENRTRSRRRRRRDHPRFRGGARHENGAQVSDRCLSAACTRWSTRARRS